MQATRGGIARAEGRRAPAQLTKAASVGHGADEPGRLSRRRPSEAHMTRTPNVARKSTVTPDVARAAMSALRTHEVTQ